MPLLGLAPGEFELVVGRLGQVWKASLIWVVLSHWLPAGFICFEGSELPRFARVLMELDADTIYVGADDLGGFALLECSGSFRKVQLGPEIGFSSFRDRLTDQTRPDQTNSGGSHLGPLWRL